MRVRFKQVWWGGTARFRPDPQGVEVPDSLRPMLPRSAVILEEKADEPISPKPANESELHAAILTAAESLDPLDEDAFTGSDKPQVDALSKILGYKITAGERDAAWAKKSEE